MKLGLISLTYFSRGHSKEFLDNLKKHLGDEFKMDLYGYNQSLNRDGIGVLDYNSNQKFSAYRKIIRRFFIGLFFYFKIRKNVRKNDINFYADYEYLSLIIGLLMFSNRNAKNYVWIHSASTDGNLFYRTYKKVFFGLIKRCNVKGYLVNGRSTSVELTRILGEEVRVKVVQYPSEINVQPIEKRTAKEKLKIQNKKVFSLIGMIRPDKNYEFAIKAFAKAKRRNEARLLIAGALSGVTERELIDWLKRHNVTDDVTLKLGYLSEEQLNICFSSSDALLIPYGQNGSSQSGPLSLARNYQLPAIVREGGELARYVRDNGVGVIATDLVEFTNAIDKLCDNPSKDLQLKLSEAKANYSWYRAAKEYKEFFHE